LLSLSLLIASRLVLGVGESLGSTGSTLWGITSAGPEHTAKVISFNGISTYGGMALSAPLGVMMDHHWGLASLGLLTMLIGAVSLVLVLRKSPVHTTPGEHLPFSSVLYRVAPHGIGLALGGIGHSTLATFVTLFYTSRHWDGGALPDCFWRGLYSGASAVHPDHRSLWRVQYGRGLPRGRICRHVSAVASLIALDGVHRRRICRSGFFARLSRVWG
jgi:hypothetical protein